MRNIKDVAYDKYKLHWMITHGYSLEDFIRCVDDYIEEDDEYLFEAYDRWEADSGFNGSLWICFDEFLGAEYQDEEYMKEILTLVEYGRYLNDKEDK